MTKTTANRLAILSKSIDIEYHCLFTPIIELCLQSINMNPHVSRARSDQISSLYFFCPLDGIWFENIAAHVECRNERSGISSEVSSTNRWLCAFWWLFVCSDKHRIISSKLSSRSANPSIMKVSQSAAVDIVQRILIDQHRKSWANIHRISTTRFSDRCQTSLIPIKYFRKIPWSETTRDWHQTAIRFRDEQSENFTFVVLDNTATLFRFGYCRRSPREATCLCILR